VQPGRDLHQPFKVRRTPTWVENDPEAWPVEPYHHVAAAQTGGKARPYLFERAIDDLCLGLPGAVAQTVGMEQEAGRARPVCPGPCQRVAQRGAERIARVGRPSGGRWRCAAFGQA
jgi:hypothetical protein